MTSLSSIPEGRALESSEFQLSSNSRKTRAGTKSSAKTAETQSSDNSEKTRATPRFKLMEEAKQNANFLVKLRPLFEKEVERFPAEVRNENEIIFLHWEALFTIVEGCTAWQATSRSHLDLRLQNLPGKNGMFQVVPKMIFSHVYSNESIQRIL